MRIINQDKTKLIEFENYDISVDGKYIISVGVSKMILGQYNTENRARGVVQIPLCFLAKSLENMSMCHAAYFCKGWENARGCKIEHDAAVAYGLEIIYED